MPAKSKKQQRFMGMVHAYQKGELKDAPESVKKAAGSMTKKASKDFAKTKHEGLPEKVKEGHGFGVDMTLDQLQQELEQLQQEHEEMLLSGDIESLDEIEEEITEIEELIHQKRLMQKDVDVAEDLKSLSFKEYLRIDEALAGPVGRLPGGPSPVGNVNSMKASDKQLQTMQTLVVQLAKMIKANPSLVVPQSRKEMETRQRANPSQAARLQRRQAQAQQRSPQQAQPTKTRLSSIVDPRGNPFEMREGILGNIARGVGGALKAAGQTAASFNPGYGQAQRVAGTIKDVASGAVKAMQGMPKKTKVPHVQLTYQIRGLIKELGPIGKRTFLQMLERLNNPDLANQVRTMIGV